MQGHRHKILGLGSATGNKACEGASARSGRAGTIGLMLKSYETWGCCRGYLVNLQVPGSSTSSLPRVVKPCTNVSPWSHNKTKTSGPRRIQPRPALSPGEIMITVLITWSTSARHTDSSPPMHNTCNLQNRTLFSLTKIA